MHTLLVTTLGAAFVAGSAFAQVTPAPAVDAMGVYQVYRTTDSRLSCDQLIAEFNVLNAQVRAQADARTAQQQTAQQAAAKAATPSPKANDLNSILGVAAQSGLVNGFGGGSRTTQAAMAAANAAMNSSAQASANQAAAQQAQAQAAAAAVRTQPEMETNEAQRLKRVQSLLQSRNC